MVECELDATVDLNSDYLYVSSLTRMCSSAVSLGSISLGVRSRDHRFIVLQFDILGNVSEDID